MSYFLDLSNLTSSDIEEIKYLAKIFDITFNQAMWEWMNDNPGKITVLGETKNGEFVRDEIDENGVREYRGEDGIIRMIEQVMKNKSEKDNDL